MALVGAPNNATSTAVHLKSCFFLAYFPSFSNQGTFLDALFHNMVSWMSLPVEIWVEIATLLPSSDLVDLVSTCSLLTSISRPILYRDLKLATTFEVEPNLAAAETFSLLARDAELARNVRSLTLDGAEEEVFDVNYAAILVHVPSLRNMSQLKTLRIIGHIFYYAEEDAKADFIEALQCLRIEELSLQYEGGCLEMFSVDQVGQISNLKRFECRSEIDLLGKYPLTIVLAIAADPRALEFFEPRCLHLLANSASTLTALSLSVMYIGSEWTSELFDMRFPLLQSLTLGTWEEEMHTPEGLHAFLLAHNTSLEHLDMGYTSRRRIHTAALIFNEDDALPVHFLPHLKSFNGHCKTVQAMAQAGMQSLTGSLATLTIGVCNIQDPKSEIDQMLDAIQAMPSALGALKELGFDFFENAEGEREWIPGFIRRWGQICGPSLEVWRGMFPFVWSWSPEELAGFFDAFSKLRVLSIANDSTVLGVFPQGGNEESEDEGDAQKPLSMPDFEEYLCQLARKCGALEEVRLAHGHRDSCWKIERGPGARLVVRQALDSD
ncbi:hypothetical protein C8F04DRAFT_1260948 [Mycena alexandri]|uniref:F-box domain-containing protein n=1 Tax=Mycena alexandri TaxID=1745969 RepID=A0AAD6SX73_9AGAR|nr:hypothetical protein C8F04DRAFT_1260948 [Mycena alexandri]